MKRKTLYFIVKVDLVATVFQFLQQPIALRSDPLGFNENTFTTRQVTSLHQL